MSSPLGAYIAGDTLLHRAPAAAKLWALAAFALAVIAFRSLPVALTALAVALALAWWAGLRGRRMLRVARGFAAVGILLFAFTAWQRGWVEALEVVCALFAVILGAAVLSSTTTATALLDTLTGGLRPFRRLGVDPEVVGLAFSLALRALPEAARLAAESRDAARARGLGRSPRAIAVPLVIRAVGHARSTGEALEARGIGDD